MNKYIKEEIITRILPTLHCLDAVNIPDANGPLMKDLSTKFSRLADVTENSFIAGIAFPYTVAMASCAADQSVKIKLAKLVENVIVGIYLRTEFFPDEMTYDAGKFFINYAYSGNGYQIIIHDIYDLSTFNINDVVANAAFNMESWND